MKLKNAAVAGTMESSDIMIAVEPAEEGEIEINLQSTVENQYGDMIRATILRVIQDAQVSGVKINAHDRGALDCTIEARVKTALSRATGCNEYDWR